ncbi:MAG: hypothetical protein ACE361_13495 [Aureliella sp.]
MAKERTRMGSLNHAWVAIAVVAIVAWAVVPFPREARSQPSQMGAGNKAMEVVSTMLPSGEQQIVVIDTESKVMAVYHVEPSQGKVQLRSVRQLAWDLQMEQFNGLSPLPSELRLMRK